MKALVLAAGFGRRLQPMTNSIPKSMVSVNGTPLLINTLNILTELGIKDIGIVVGHMADYIKKNIGYYYKTAQISYFENTQYLLTNNVFSLYQAISFCNDDMLMLECDIYYHKEMLEKLVNDSGECSILVSPFNSKTMDGSIIHMNRNGDLELVLGKWQGNNFDYKDSWKTVNMYRFTKEFAKKYMSLIEWYVNNMGKNSYYEKILGSLIYLQESNIHIVEVPEDMWCEIDNMDDLIRARERFGN